jgi:glutathione S-transferase
MAFTLYYHPLASYCHKVLVALHESGTRFRGRIIDLGNPVDQAEMNALWPVGKFPVLRDEATGRTIPESTVIVEYLCEHAEGAADLLPADPDARLDVRLWDRVFDNYVQTPMQKIVADRFRPEGGHDPQGVADARVSLHQAYDLLEARLVPGAWAVGDRFTLADCSAMPALFYASILEPFADRHVRLSAYFDRLMDRPSVRRTLDEARPYFPMFPFHDLIPARFLRGA